MAQIKIDGVDYDLDTLPEAAKVQLQSLQYVDAELARLAAHTAAFKTARAVYAKALKNALAPSVDSANPLESMPVDGGTIKFS